MARAAASRPPGSGCPATISFRRTRARPFGVHRPTAAIHSGIASKGKNEPPSITIGNSTRFESMPPACCPEASNCSSTK